MNTDKPPLLEIEGERVARALGLDTSEFRTLMAQGRIAVLCERGTAEDAGTYRASFYHGKARARFVIDGTGAIVSG